MLKRLLDHLQRSELNACFCTLAIHPPYRHRAQILLADTPAIPWIVLTDEPDDFADLPARAIRHAPTGPMAIDFQTKLPPTGGGRGRPAGTLRFNAGSIAIHALRTSFIERLNQGGRLKLPWHRAEKKVPYVDERGKPVKPEKPNAVKLEQFVFDAIP